MWAYWRPSVARLGTKDVGAPAYLEGADKGGDTSNVVMLAIQEALQQEGADAKRHVGMHYSRLENFSNDGIGLFYIELLTAEQLAGRPGQPGLKQLHRRGYAKEQAEWYAIKPGAGLGQKAAAAEGRTRGSQDSPNQGDQICQQARVKGFAVLEGNNNNMTSRGSLEMTIQSFQVVIQVPATLDSSVVSADGRGDARG